MEQFITGVPTTPMGILSTFLVVLAGIIWFTNRTNREDSKLLRETNADLRLAHEDNEKKINQLIDDVKCLTEKVTKLEHQKKSLEVLVVEGLELYFQKNPEQALKLREKK